MNNLIDKIIYKPISWFFVQRFKYRFKRKLITPTWQFRVITNNRKLTFCEYFYKLDRSKWNTSFPWGRHDTNDWQWKTDWENIELEQPITMSHGTCACFITKHKPGEEKIWSGNYKYNYTSAHLDSLGKFEQLYGRFEAKIKVSGIPGLWSAFWLLTPVYLQGLKEVILPEIDIFECFGNDDSKYRDMLFTHHWGLSYDKPYHKWSSTHIGPKLDFNDWYIYAIEWTPKSLKWYINNELVKICKTNIPKKAMYIIIDDGPNEKMNNYRALLPNGMKVDWIKVYKYENK